MDSMNSGAYHWPQSNSMATSQSAIDSSLGSARSLPSTPAVTPPAHNIATMPPYGSAQGYDGSRGYATGAQHPTYPSQVAQSRAAYGQQDQYVKAEMHAPPSRAGAADDSDSPAEKSTGAVLQSNGPPSAVSHHGSTAGEDDGDQEHDAEYTHNSDPYESTRAAYQFTGQAVDHPHLAGDMTSPSHGVVSGRATPRTAVQPSAFYPQSGGYTSPSRQGGSSVYNVMNDRVAAPSGSDGSNPYGPSADMPLGSNGVYDSSLATTSSLKRSREEDDDQGRPTDTAGDFKRRRIIEARGSRR
jgi:protein SOK2